MRKVFVIIALLIAAACFAEKGPEYPAVAIVRHESGRMGNEICAGIESVSLSEFKYFYSTRDDPHLIRVLREVRPDVIVAIGAFNLQRVGKITEIPVVYASAFIPLIPPAPNVAGAFRIVSPDKQFEVISERLPQIRHVGFVYSEKYTGILADKLQTAATAHGIRITAFEIESEAEALDRAKELSGKTGALLVISDILAFREEASAAALFELSARRKYPIIACTERHHKMGAVLSVIAMSLDTGINTGILIERILRGKKPSALPWKFVEAPVIMQNPEVAREIGVEIRVGRRRK